MAFLLRILFLTFSFIMYGCQESVLEVENKSIVQGASSLQTIKGTATLGPLRNATVVAYKLDNKGKTTGSALASTTTNNYGSFSLSIKPQSGPFIIVVSGGKYKDETTELDKDLTSDINVVLANSDHASEYASSKIGVSAITTLESKLARNMLLAAGNADDTQVKQIIEDANAILSESFGVDPKIAAANIFASNYDPTTAAGYSAALQAGVSMFTHRTGISMGEWAEMMAMDITDGAFDGRLNGIDITFKDSQGTDLSLSSGSDPLTELADAMNGLDAVKTDWDFSGITQTIVSDPVDKTYTLTTSNDITTELITVISSQEANLTLDTGFGGNSYDQYIDFSDPIQNTFATETATQELSTTVTASKIVFSSPMSTLTVDASQTTVYVAVMDDKGNVDITKDNENISIAKLPGSVGTLTGSPVTLTKGVGSFTVTSNAIGMTKLSIGTTSFDKTGLALSTQEIIFTHGAIAKLVISAPSSTQVDSTVYMNVLAKDQFNNAVTQHDRVDVDLSLSANGLFYQQVSQTTTASLTLPITGGRGDFYVTNNTAEIVDISMAMNAQYSNNIDTSSTSYVTFNAPSQDVSGSAALGPINGGLVSVYSLDGSGNQDLLITTATTDINGDFTLTMPEQIGPFMITISGGSYVDEATGATQDVVDPIKIFMPDSATYEQYYMTSGIAVTALTTMEAELATNIQTLSGNTSTTDLQQAISDANTLISDVFQIDPDAPVANIYDESIDLTSDEGKNALIQAGISVLTAQLDLSYKEYAELMALDLSDGILDGAVSGETITYEASQGTYLSLVDTTSTQTTTDLLEQAIQTFSQVSSNTSINGQTLSLTFNDDVSYYSTSINLSSSLDQATLDMLTAYESENLAAAFNGSFTGDAYTDFVDLTSTEDIYGLLNLNASTTTTATKVTIVASLDAINPTTDPIPVGTMFYICVYAMDDTDVLDANFAATTGVTINSTSANLVNFLGNTAIPFGGGGGCDIYSNNVAETLTVSLTDEDTSLNTDATLQLTFSP